MHVGRLVSTCVWVRVECCVCISVTLCVSLHVCVCVCVCISVSVVCEGDCVCTSVRVCACMRACTCVRACVCVCVHRSAHTCTDLFFDAILLQPCPSTLGLLSGCSSILGIHR